MSKKLYTLFFYFGLALFCIHSCTGFYTAEDFPNEYEKAIEELQYQIGYIGLYHSRSTDNIKEMSGNVTYAVTGVTIKDLYQNKEITFSKAHCIQHVVSRLWPPYLLHCPLTTQLCSTGSQVSVLVHL